MSFHNGEAFLKTLEPELFWPIEFEGIDAFRWTPPRFDIQIPAPGWRFATVRFCSPKRGNSLRLIAGDKIIELPLLEGWQRIDLESFGEPCVVCEVGEAINEPGRGRVGLMLSEILFHDDAERHAKISGRHRNAILNEAEFLAGVETLETVPAFLRLTLSKTCNIANEKPCVYCSWDWAKRLEAGAPDQDAAFLNRLGRHMDLALYVNDCSYGEPPLEKSFSEMVELATDTERHFEFTSNGQTLSAKNRARMLGRSVLVHISIDAASAAGYNRYRDHSFDMIIDNLRAFVREREAFNGKPEIFVSFIVMRSNVEEAGPFLRLMKDVGIDNVSFRTLYLEDRLEARRTVHYGFKFDYDAECLSAEELFALAPKLRTLGREVDIPTVVEWDDFPRNVGPRQAGEPLCSEPWKTAYLLNRGIMPCCYGREPMVSWSEVDQSNLEAGITQAINSEPFRQLRRDLRAGRLGAYCERAQGCPVVKARRHAASI